MATTIVIIFTLNNLYATQRPHAQEGRPPGYSGYALQMQLERGAESPQGVRKFIYGFNIVIII